MSREMACGNARREMRIYFKSNIFLPGLEGRESLDFDGPGLTVRRLLEETAALAGQAAVEYVRPGALQASDDWEVLVNGVDLQGFGGMDSPLAEGDKVTVNMRVVGGG